MANEFSPLRPSNPYNAKAGSGDSTHQAAAKRLRKQAIARGNSQRNATERNAPRWANEPSGGPISFQKGSFPPKGK